MKLLIVDDSALMRKQLGELFEQAGGFAVAFARNGREAVSMNLEFAPDVVTLDINMPELDGLSALAEMMLQRPVPVIMLSSLTAQGALATFEALALGAVDYVAKPGGTISLGIDALRAELVAKVRGAAKAKVRGPDGAPTATSTRTAGRTVARPAEPAEPACASTVPLDARQPGVVVIGVSTGGPRTLERILPQLPAHFPWPVVVAQHMPTSFTAPFAERLGRLCALRVVEAAQPMPLAAGTVYVCKGGADSIFTTRNGRPTLVSRPPDATQLWHPSVSLLGASALQLYAPQAIVGVMLTGMGSDGAEAFADIRQAGGRTIAESEQSAVVFGMPAELIRRGGASSVLPADRIAGQLIQWLCPLT
ncbi:chemotaxis-specific protein-glutamate methyltransferase CheB [Herbaspirillum aquaticum]|jgi:two-component system chemotaxis response regulator CheB|uniref:Protein-glutamate methylesterase/protein-glutamine glutaminase n=1 Tax=Herbaspirillum aquaticum TaxID=568783 RepID=A0A225SZ60_9BURK|nr:chemotaxis-specific protein-glutamate methyltransferase CheB [Herbaspirillum aquaticum]MBW9333246.1 chemotaxis-specific protein-glutamate methyltransferase CheB [Herbaspirillum sp. RU 5E]OWY36360.1 chemotaxis response regulator protein-glutamate methylesterase [Herbaspirillum aquaticum]